MATRRSSADVDRGARINSESRSGDRRQEAGGRRQETGGRRQETGEAGGLRQPVPRLLDHARRLPSRVVLAGRLTFGCTAMRKPFVSVIIPVLRDADSLAALLGVLHPTTQVEVIVANGDAGDPALELVRRAWPVVQWVDGPPGRGRQMNAGAECATGQWLLFLHADARLEDGWLDEIRRAADDGRGWRLLSARDRLAAVAGASHRAWGAMASEVARARLRRPGAVHPARPVSRHRGLPGNTRDGGCGPGAPGWGATVGCGIRRSACPCRQDAGNETAGYGALCPTCGSCCSISRADLRTVWQRPTRPGPDPVALPAATPDVEWSASAGVPLTRCGPRGDHGRGRCPFYLVALPAAVGGTRC